MICTTCAKLNEEGFLCGQGFTDWTCQKCGRTFTHHNTAVPKVCPECSEKYGICEECGEPIIGNSINDMRITIKKIDGDDTYVYANYIPKVIIEECGRKMQ